MKVYDYIRECHSTAVEKGFWEKPRDRGEALALIGSELLGEALEAHRKGDVENLAEEMADVLIRLFDFLGGFGYVGYMEWDILDAELADIEGHAKCHATFSPVVYQALSVSNNFGHRAVVAFSILSNIILPTDMGYCHHPDKDARCLSMFLCAVCCMCADLDIDIIPAMDKKMKYNKGRERLHGKKY